MGRDLRFESLFFGSFAKIKKGIFDESYIHTSFFIDLLFMRRCSASGLPRSSGLGREREECQEGPFSRCVSYAGGCKPYPSGTSKVDSGRKTNAPFSGRSRIDSRPRFRFFLRTRLHTTSREVPGKLYGGMVSVHVHFLADHRLQKRETKTVYGSMQSILQTSE